MIIIVVVDRRIGSKVEVFLEQQWKEGIVIELGGYDTNNTTLILSMLIGDEYVYCSYEYDNLQWYQDFTVDLVRRPGQQQEEEDEDGGGGGTLKDDLLKLAWYKGKPSQSKRNGNMNNNKKNKNKKARKSSSSHINGMQLEVVVRKVCDVCRDNDDEVMDNPIIYCARYQ